MILPPALRYVARALVAAPPAPPPPAGVEWSAVLAVAQAGRIEPLLLRAVRNSGAPEDVLAALDARSRRVAFAQLRGLGERDAVLGALAHAGVGPVVLLKGAVLALLVYPDPLLRSTNDLDLLIPRDQLAIAGDALVDALGYEAIDLFPGRPASRDAFHERLLARDLVGGRVRQLVELHTGFAHDFRYPIDYPAVLRRALPFPEGGPGACRLDDEDQLLHLAVHMAREHFMGPLKQLLDMHLWVERCGQHLNWSLLIGRALRWGAGVALAEALRLSEALFHTAVPPELAVGLGARGLRGRFLRWWHTPGGVGLVRRAVSYPTARAIAWSTLLDSPGQQARALAGYGRLRVLDTLSRSWRGNGAP